MSARRGAAGAWPRRGRAAIAAALALLAGTAGTAWAQAGGAAADKRPAGPAGPAAPAAPLAIAPQAPLPPTAFVGPWTATEVAEYSTCPKVPVGDRRVVTWLVTIDKKDTRLAVLDEKGGAKTDAKRLSGRLAGTTLALRAGKTAGLDLVDEGDGRLSGRFVVSREGGCVVVYALTAERKTDRPFDVGSSDPDAGQFGLTEALAGLPGEGKLWADLVTEGGTLTCELFPAEAPNTVANFVGLARGLRAFRSASGRWLRYQRYYDGLAFHRVIPGFVIQAGDPLSRDWSTAGIGTGGPGYTIANEPNGLRFDRPGRLAMAHRGLDTAGSQFFITEAKATQLDGQYTIFGQCGPADVVGLLARVPANAQTAKPDLPLVIKSVTIRR